METNVFDKISIRGRIAFGICCLENLIASLKYPIEDWKIVFQQLWDISTARYVDEWDYATVEYLPECILEFNYYKCDNWDYIDEKTYKALYILYHNINETIPQIMNLIHKICSVELYTRIIVPAPNSLIPLNRIIDIMEKNKFELPDVSRFRILSINDGQGWGEKFKNDEFSKFDKI